MQLLSFLRSITSKQIIPQPNNTLWCSSAWTKTNKWLRICLVLLYIEEDQTWSLDFWRRCSYCPLEWLHLNSILELQISRKRNLFALIHWLPFRKLISQFTCHLRCEGSAVLPYVRSGHAMSCHRCHVSPCVRLNNGSPVLCNSASREIALYHVYLLLSCEQLSLSQFLSCWFLEKWNIYIK